jgi:hypothetical protein
MGNPLYQQLAGAGRGNSMLQRLMQFKKMVTGDPQQIVQNMISSGRISQAQVNQYAQQANEIYKQFKDFM